MNGTQVSGKKCNQCTTVCAPSNSGRRGFRGMTRGLCNRCYGRLLAMGDGSLERMADRPLYGPNTDPEGRRRVKADGYVTIKRGGQVIPEHRAVMEEALGRALVGGENVHHMNGDRADNAIANLELWYSPQPSGQRVENLIDYMVNTHPERLIQALHLDGRTGMSTNDDNNNEERK